MNEIHNNPSTSASPPPNGEKKPSGRTFAGSVVSVPSDFQLMFSALRRCWRWATPLGLIAAALGACAAWSWQTPSRYMASAVLQVLAAPPQVAFPTGEPRADFAIYRQSQLAMLRSRLVLTSAVNDPEVVGLAIIQSKVDPVLWVESALKADYGLGQEFLRVSLKGNDPQELKALVSAVTRAYLREVVNKEQDRRRSRLDMLVGLHQKFEAGLADRRQAVQDLVRLAGSNDAHVLAIKQELAFKRLHDAEQELISHQADIRRQEVELAALQAREKANDGHAIPEAEVHAVLHQDSVVVRYMADIAQQEATLEHIARVARSRTEPSYVKCLREIEILRTKLAERTAAQRPAVVAQLQLKARGRVQARMAFLDENTAILKAQEKVVSSLVDRLSQEPRSLNESALGLEILRTEIAQDEGMGRRIAAEMEMLKVEMHAPDRVKVLEEPVVVSTKEEQRRLQVTVLAGLGSFGLVLFGLAHWEAGARRFGTATEVVNVLGLPLLGVLPVLAGSARKKLTLPGPVQPGYGLLLWADAVDAACAAMVDQAEQVSSRVLLVVSALRNEGKTSLATGLAVSLARAGYRTLLIDGDLRCPSLHQLFNRPQGPGLCAALRGEVLVGEAVRETSVDGLWLLPAGQLDDAAGKALAQSACKAVLHQLRDAFAYVIIDSSPALLVAEPLLIARHVDAAIVSVRRDVSELPAVAAVCERLATLRIPVLGAVAQGMKTLSYGNAYVSTPARQIS